MSYHNYGIDGTWQDNKLTHSKRMKTFIFKLQREIVLPSRDQHFVQETAKSSQNTWSVLLVGVALILDHKTLKFQPKLHNFNVI